MPRITEEKMDPRLVESGERLQKIISERWGGRPMNRYTIHDIENFIQDYRMRDKARGIDFPKVKVLALPSVSYIQIVRADYDKPDIKNLVLKICATFPSVAMADVVAAIHKAFPDYRPESMMQDVYNDPRSRKVVLQ